MRTLLAAVLCSTALAVPAIAQPMDRMHHRAPPRLAASAPAPDVNAAFMGGGVILEGAPNAPAPRPEPTAPGQQPRYMVEPGTPPAYPLSPIR